MDDMDIPADPPSLPLVIPASVIHCIYSRVFLSTEVFSWFMFVLYITYSRLFSLVFCMFMLSLVFCMIFSSFTCLLYVL